MWFLAVALVANSLLLGSTGAGEAYACSCAGGESTEEAFRSSTAVFSGKVKKVKGASPESTEAVNALLSLGPVTFEVQEAWKGVSGNSVVVYGQGLEASCGMDFDRGETYLVYAYRIDKTWGRTTAGAPSRCRMRASTSAS